MLADPGWLDLRTEASAHLPDLEDLPDLTPEERAMAGRTWRGRMVNEHASAQVFAALVPQLMRAGVPSTMLRQVAGYVDDELRHAEQCAGVVTTLGMEARAPLPELVAIPSHDDVGPVEAALRNVVSVGCLSETVAVAIIRAEQAELDGTALGEVLTSILADEVRHARMGWELLGLLLPRLDADARARLSDYLIDALAHQLAWELPKLPVNLGLRAELAAAGVCDGGEAREIFFATVTEVIVPALDRAGLDGSGAWKAALELQHVTPTRSASPRISA